MDVQTVIDTATTANAVALGFGPATELFRECIRNNIKITTNLKKAQQECVKRLIPFSVTFTNTHTITSDHPMIAALRETARIVYEKTFKVSHLSQRGLVIGSSDREISMYSENAHIHHYIYAGENKDLDKIVRPALDKISLKLKSKANKSNNKVFRENELVEDCTKQRPAVKRYNDLRQIITDYTLLHKLPGNIHTEVVDATILLFEDSIYNYTKETLTHLFQQSGAYMGYGYAMLPMELIFDNLPKNKLYNFEKDGDQAFVTFPSGVSNGYRHFIESWKLILSSPVITHKGTHLMVEIVSRIGPMCVFKLIKATRPEKIVRNLGLNDTEAFVQLLDMEQMYDPASEKLLKPFKYFSVREDEFFDAANYLGAIDEVSKLIKLLRLRT